MVGLWQSQRCGGRWPGRWVTCCLALLGRVEELGQGQANLLAQLLVAGSLDTKMAVLGLDSITIATQRMS